MRIAVAAILQESNTFSPVFTRYQDFSPVYGDAVLQRHSGKLTEMGGFLDVLSARSDVEIVPICAAWAITANRLDAKGLAKLGREFIRMLSSAGHIDGLLLAMHGAQTAEGADDVEGHFLALARNVLGSAIPIVLSLDLHANVTQAMAERANAIVGYHTYPHVDLFETGQKAARLMLRILDGKAKPTMARAKIPLIVNAENSQTSHGPFARLLAMGKKLEASGKAEAVSLFPVQPWMDIAEMGCAVTVVTNDDLAGAQRQAARIAQRFWDTRREFEPELVLPEEAIRRAGEIDGGPIVLAESSDSTGSGSPGDSTGVLKHLIHGPEHGPAAIFLVDPFAVGKAMAAGIGKTVRMAIGGCFDKKNSKPVKVAARVRQISEGRWTPRARGYNTGIECSMGPAVVLEHGNTTILVGSQSAMTVDPALFRDHGIEPLHQKIVVVKSPNGFRACYEPIAKAIFVVDTPGVSTANLKTLPWERIERPIYPLDPETRYQA